ncbi:hypothetical protein QP166_00510 [Sphingomonas sp. LR60]|uniref:hypothetical protein n=1 Tax=Sphingomonas sp. LR60 TaxID=3050233 RepID=UPI002FE3B6D5
MSRSAERSRPLARPIFLLVVVSVLVTAVISFTVTFSGPPPFEPPRSLTGIARALKGERPPFGFGGLPPGSGDRALPPGGFRHRPVPLHRDRLATPPGPRPDERPNVEAAARLAAMLRVPATDVRAFTQPGRSEGEAFSGDWTFGWRQDGGWWVVRSQQRPWLTRWHVRTLLALLAAILLLSIPGWWLARAITRPLRLLAAAADRAGTGAPLPTFPADRVRSATSRARCRRCTGGLPAMPRRAPRCSPASPTTSARRSPASPSASKRYPTRRAPGPLPTSRRCAR